MKILEHGCTCPSCLEKTKLELIEARKAWENGYRSITFQPYHYSCSDGCCDDYDDYGTRVYVNGFQITGDGENIESVIEAIMEFLEISEVQINTEYDEI